MSNQTFNDLYMTISRKDKHHIKVRNKIVTDCKISTPVFYNWIKGITAIPHWAKPIICEIMKMPHSVLFPEDNDTSI